MEYKGYKRISAETDWCSLIRQKINNLYSRYFDSQIIIQQDYMYLLQTPKRLYYQWIDGMDIDSDELSTSIYDAMNHAEQLKNIYQKQKMDLSWQDYKRLIESLLQKIFENCKLVEDYEDDTKLNHMYDFFNEDNFYIKYFCKSLEAYLKNYNKAYYGLKRGRNKQYRYCKDCYHLFELHTFNQKRCPNCQKIYTRKNKTYKQRKYRVEKLKN